jgi:DNA invertase Pin-like site-specific DNA recombinase
MKVVILSRVSTQNQDNQRQINELTDYSKNRNWDVVKVFEEKISGITKNEERPILMDMITFIQKNNIDKVLCWELSRIGRKIVEVLETIELLNQKKISLFIKNYNLETLDDNKEVLPLSQFLVQVLSSVNMMERLQIRQRIKSGYDNYRKSGGTVGRKKGFKKSNDDLLKQHSDIIKYLKQGQSVRNTMKLTDKSSGTIQKVKRLLDDH